MNAGNVFNEVLRWKMLSPCVEIFWGERTILKQNRCHLIIAYLYEQFMEIYCKQFIITSEHTEQKIYLLKNLLNNFIEFNVN